MMLLLRKECVLIMLVMSVLERGARVAAGAGVLADIPPGETWSGYPAKPIRQSLREAVWLARQVSRKASPATKDQAE